MFLLFPIIFHWIFLFPVKLIPPSKPDITRLSNTSVMVRWTVGNGGLPINFFKVQYKEVGKRKSDWMTIDEDIAAHIHSYAVTGLRTGKTLVILNF